jgi:hypothetical protein
MHRPVSVCHPDPDAPREGIKTLAHLAGALSLETDQDGPRIVRFPYEVLCRLAGRQCRALGDQPGKAAETSDHTEVTEVTEAPRLCTCGTKLTGRVDQRHCSPRCRMKASLSNPERIAKRRGSRSVTATNHSHQGCVTPYKGS